MVADQSVFVPDQSHHHDIEDRQHDEAEAAAEERFAAGFIEVKAPGKGADPRKLKDIHDREQWGKLKSLPNLIYTDGNAFSLWRGGKLHGEIIHLQGDVETSGAKLRAPPGLQSLFSLTPISAQTSSWNVFHGIVFAGTRPAAMSFLAAALIESFVGTGPLGGDGQRRSISRRSTSICEARRVGLRSKQAVLLSKYVPLSGHQTI